MEHWYSRVKGLGWISLESPSTEQVMHLRVGFIGAISLSLSLSTALSTVSTVLVRVPLYLRRQFLLSKVFLVFWEGLSVGVLDGDG